MGFQHPLLTDSCTRALEIVAHAIDIKPGDEVVVPTYGYPTTADVFAQCGASLVYADAQKQHPNPSLSSIREVLTSKTKAVVTLHYGGFSSDILALRKLCDEKGIYLIEDNAHGIGCSVHNQVLGSIGHFSATSFHQTKNVHGFSGGLLNVNVAAKIADCERYYYKGTNRADFQAGTVPYYQWVTHGSSCEINALAAAFLWHHLQLMEEINAAQRNIWQGYLKAFKGQSWNLIAENMDLEPSQIHNAHIYPLCFRSVELRNHAKEALAAKGIAAYPHYHALHASIFGQQWKTKDLPEAKKYSEGLLRLPIYPDLSTNEQGYIIEQTLVATKSLV